MNKQDLKQEAEANHFAICLLMPRDMFIKEWRKLVTDKVDEETIAIKLAKIFQVPLWACAIRMTHIDWAEVYG